VQPLILPLHRMEGIHFKRGTYLPQHRFYEEIHERP